MHKNTYKNLPALSLRLSAGLLEEAPKGRGNLPQTLDLWRLLRRLRLLAMTHQWVFRGAHKKIAGTLAVTGCVLLLAACATTKFAVKRMAPARYNIADVQKLGILGFSSEISALEGATNEITGLIHDRLEENGFFGNVVTVGKYKGMPVETPAIIIPALLTDVGKEAKVDALIFGQVERYWSKTSEWQEKVEREVPTGRYRNESYVEDGQTKTRQVEIKKKEVEYVPHARREANVAFRIGVLRMSDGKFIGEDEFADSRRINAEGDSEIRGMPGERTMLDGMLDKLSTRFVNSMVPHEVTEYIKMQGDKSSKEAIKRAREGKWSESIELLDNVALAEPFNHVAFYNLGIAHEHEGELEKARDCYREAMKLSNKPLYNESWIRVHDIMQQGEKLKKQMGGRK